MAKKIRYRICTDESFHDYAVPVHLVEEFYQLIEIENGGEAEECYAIDWQYGKDFDQQSTETKDFIKEILL